MKSIEQSFEIFLKSVESSDPSHQKWHIILGVHNSLKPTLVVKGLPAQFHCSQAVRKELRLLDKEFEGSKAGLLPFRGLVGSLWTGWVRPQVQAP